MTSRHVIHLNGKPYIFDRRRHAHPWEAELARLHSSAVPGAPALAANWRMDARVDDARENQLTESPLFPSTTVSTDFCKAVTDYFAYHQCRQVGATPEPDYASAANSSNLIPVAQRPSRNHFLLHIASINRLLTIILRAANPNRADFQIQLSRLTGERPLTSATFREVDRLADSLTAMGPDTVKRFARITSDALGENEPFWWAAFAHEIGNFAATEDWTEAARTLGLGHLETGERLIAWRYSPELLAGLYRPTVAEARDSGFHFPSPPGSDYGITMPLTDAAVAVKELLHAPLKSDLSFAYCTGTIGKIENPPAPLNAVSDISRWFSERRSGHRAYLGRQFLSDGAQNWLRRHAGLP